MFKKLDPMRFVVAFAVMKLFCKPDSYLPDMICDKRCCNSHALRLTECVILH